MNRRHFFKTTTLAGIGLSIFPQLAFQNATKIISYKELIGKGNPQLFGDGFNLRKDAYDAFIKLTSEALKSDIRIQVVSSYRGFQHQNRIWERKYKQNINNGLSPKESIRKIIEYSTIPGTSRHHWGTDLDLIDANVKQPRHVLNPSHFEGDGPFSKFKSWMDEHANDFGFYLVYTNEKDRKGFKYEPWHYSYKPLSKPYLKAYRKLDLKDIITSEKLMGGTHFSETFITNYLNQNILDINPELL
ncbi:M15 family metallopeptidase [uncultured Psychroserpens sp.]|uniref:M15 family metallopeptidase n=1 Tax=uncultured Psychroserpens sp. TaxID=255436 RepID=UPI00262C97F2|nr:M15 family metallopeptidase [uncultured Psychroserpens sp.]